MKLIISPAKQMRRDTDTLPPSGLPELLDQTRILAEQLRKLEYPALKKLLDCNDALAERAFRLYHAMDLEREDTPAILAYDGIQYKYMAPQVFTEREYAYVQAHLRMISGFYGLLRPLDAVAPYRLEMQARLRTDFCRDLYDFWGDAIYRTLTKEDRVILNLASREYSRAVEPFLTADDIFVTCVFGEELEGRVVEKGVYVKMARGEMVRFLAETGGETLEDAKGFHRLGFTYREELSDARTLVFVGQPPGGKTKKPGGGVRKMI